MRVKIKKKEGGNGVRKLPIKTTKQVMTFQRFKDDYLVTTSLMGSGCGSVGRAVTLDTRGPRFESCHWQKFIFILNI